MRLADRADVGGVAVGVWVNSAWGSKAVKDMLSVHAKVRCWHQAAAILVVPVDNSGTKLGLSRRCLWITPRNRMHIACYTGGAGSVEKLEPKNKRFRSFESV